MKSTSLLIILMMMFQGVSAQPVIHEKIHRDEAFQAVKELKYNGALVVRLETSHVKIKAFENNLKNPKLKPAARKRIQSFLDDTRERNEIINRNLMNAFSDSFNFCPVYFCYDSSAGTLKNGARKNIFLNKELAFDSSVEIPDAANIFVIYYHEKSGNYPTDGLMMRRLNKVLEEPFPAYTPVRESFVNEVNSPRIRRVVYGLDDRLRKLLARAEKRG